MSDDIEAVGGLTAEEWRVLARAAHAGRLLQEKRADAAEARVARLEESNLMAREHLGLAREALAHHGDPDDPDLTQEGNFCLGHVDGAIACLLAALDTETPTEEGSE